MRKSILSASIAAMIGGLGFAGAASAAVFSNAANNAGTISASTNGVGDILIVPYFTAQSNNATLLNITNTDTTNGKAVKVRFRGASNSDDIFDFQLFLSPGDVWAAKISKDSASGKAMLETSDTSCTLPDQVGKSVDAKFFVTGRLNSKLTGDALAAETREGYVEILTMANIPKAGFGDQAPVPAAGAPMVTPTVNPLYAATKHVNNVAPCFSTTAGAAALNLLAYDPSLIQYQTDANNDSSAAAGYSAAALGLTFPTGGLMANYTIIDVVNTATFSGEAVALVASKANLVFFPQSSGEVGAGNGAGSKTGTYVGSAGAIVQAAIKDVTADPLFRGDSFYVKGSGVNASTVVVTNTTAIVTPGNYDLPDLSTPYAVTPTAGVNDQLAKAQAKALTAALATTSVTNEYLTTTGIAATTDWVFSMPTRRYAVAYNYATTAADGRIFSSAVDDVDAYFTLKNTSVGTSGYQICVDSSGLTQYNREETTPASPTNSFVVSPSTVEKAAIITFCGEATVVSINNPGATTSGALKATVAVKSLTLATGNEGWLKIGTDGLTPAGANAKPLGLPVVGKAFVRSGSFAANWAHRTAAPVKPQ